MNCIVCHSPDAVTTDGRCNNCAGKTFVLNLPSDPMTDYEKLEGEVQNYFDRAYYASVTLDGEKLTRYEMTARLLEDIKSFLSRSLEKSFNLGEKVERESWTNQKANQHDERIRKAERQRIMMMLKGMRGIHPAYNQAIDDIIKELES